MSLRLRIGLILALVAVLAAVWMYVASRPHRSKRVVSTAMDLVLKPEPPLQLPEVAAADGSRWQLPTSVILHFHHDGRITYRYYPRDDAFLREQLQGYSDKSRDLEDPMQPSLVALVLRCDRRAPWRAVQRVIDIAGGGDIRMNRLHAVVRVPGVAGEQTIALRSPLFHFNVLFHLDKRARADWGPRIELSSGADLEPLDGFVPANLERLNAAVPLVAVDGDVPAGEVIAFVERFRAAGGTEFLFVNPDLASLGEPVLELVSPAPRRDGSRRDRPAGD